VIADRDLAIADRDFAIDDRDDNLQGC